MNILKNIGLFMILIVPLACSKKEKIIDVTQEVRGGSLDAEINDVTGFSLIPSGEFMMSDASDEQKVATVHKVKVGAFHMQQQEVTKEQWTRVRMWAIEHGYADLPEGKSKAEGHPVQSVSWYAVVKWCNAMSEMEGLTPCYYTNVEHTLVYRNSDKNIENMMVKWDATGYRLPTEAEWEKAARGGLVGKRFPWGDRISHSDANFNNLRHEDYQTGSRSFHPTYKTGGFPYTSPVGSFAANGLGLYDMAGNVVEWCWDYEGIHSSIIGPDPHGPASGSDRVFRGGSWQFSAADSEIAVRSGMSPSFYSESFGFRLARGIDPRVDERSIPESPGSLCR